MQTDPSLGRFGECTVQDRFDRVVDDEDEEEGDGDCPVELMKEFEVGSSLGNEATVRKSDENDAEEEVKEHCVEIHASYCPPAHLQDLSRVSFYS